MEVSNCCGAELYDDYDICPKCLEHCDREKEITDEELSYLIKSLHPQFDDKKREA
tara:strand:+ start:2235 stop:2399 length:165 start_codon:yes stop_codon:yes gene_type:complete